MGNEALAGKRTTAPAWRHQDARGISKGMAFERACGAPALLDCLPGLWRCAPRPKNAMAACYSDGMVRFFPILVIALVLALIRA